MLLTENYEKLYKRANISIDGSAAIQYLNLCETYFAKLFVLILVNSIFSGFIFSILKAVNQSILLIRIFTDHVLSYVLLDLNFQADLTLTKDSQMTVKSDKF